MKKTTAETAATTAPATAEGAAPPDGLPVTPFYLKQMAAGRVCVTVHGVPDNRIFVNVDPGHLREAERSKVYPGFIVRRGQDLYSERAVREVEYLGGCNLEFTPESPLPCTSSGSAYMAASGPVRCYVDPNYLATSEVDPADEFTRLIPADELYARKRQLGDAK